jgi:transcriptional regulator with XRE-family HTH domain
MDSNLPVGALLRTWRQRRHLSQLDLALDAEISPRHMSFMETGRALPSREMLLRLSERLAVPLRERNTLLVAAGYAPVYRERRLEDPALSEARKAVELVLQGHEPYPALAVDRHWNMLSANRVVAPLLDGVAAELLQTPVNVLRLSLHPSGLAPRIANLEEWRGHLLARLRHQIDVTADAVLGELLKELCTYPAPDATSIGAARASEYAGVVVPLRLNSHDTCLSLFSTTTLFGTPMDISLAELAIESFFPADAATAEALRRAGGST